jgi:hypothetical protein
LQRQLLEAAVRSALIHQAEADRLRAISPHNWQPIWVEEQKALSARKIAEAIGDILTSEGNK